jgi:hypothetical protein
MAWPTRRRARRYYNQIISARPRFDIIEYFALKRTKSCGTERTLRFLCDGGKYHKITFRERGRITLHDHVLKCERALMELSDEAKMPRCIRILDAWKKAANHSYGLHLDWARITNGRGEDVNPFLGFRQHVHDWKRANKTFEDVDNLDIHITKRMENILRAWAKQLLDRIHKITPNPVVNTKEAKASAAKAEKLMLTQRYKMIPIEPAQPKVFLKAVKQVAKPLQTLKSQLQTTPLKKLEVVGVGRNLTK